MTVSYYEEYGEWKSKCCEAVTVPIIDDVKNRYCCNECGNECDVIKIVIKRHEGTY